MTTIYFIRHAEPDYSNHDDLTRSLTAKGRQDTHQLAKYFEDKQIDVVLSSPYCRAIETVKGIAEMIHSEVITVEDFRERRVDSCWIEDFDGFVKKQWEDFEYKLSDGECLREVQQRNIAALNKVLAEHPNKNLVIGSHGTALSTIINYYDPSFGYEDFNKIRALMPWTVKMSFEAEQCIGIDYFAYVVDISFK